MLYFRLEYRNEDFTLVFPLPIRESRKLGAYHSEFRKEIAEFPIWPERLDEVLFSEFAHYYRRIGRFFDINPHELTPVSRHHFFVSSELFEHEGQEYPGLSFVQKLLNFSYPKPSEQSSFQQEIITTGDASLDVVTDALLIFKVPGLENYYSLDELSKLCKQANERLRQAEEASKGENKGGDENLESEELDEDFVTDRVRLFNWLTNLGIEVPLEF